MRNSTVKKSVKSKRRKITAEFLREELKYNRVTGVFTRRKNGRKHSAGDVAGTITKRGYVAICVGGVREYGHRLAVLYVKGRWPLDGLVVDHRDGVHSNNAWRNLREGTQGNNLENQRRARSDNVSGLMGANLHPSGKYTSTITYNGKKTYLGIFDTAEAAHAAYVKAKRRLHKFNML